MLYTCIIHKPAQIRGLDRYVVLVLENFTQFCIRHHVKCVHLNTGVTICELLKSVCIHTAMHCVRVCIHQCIVYECVNIYTSMHCVRVCKHIYINAVCTSM